jgi:hypothetical protein
MTLYFCTHATLDPLFHGSQYEPRHVFFIIITEDGTLTTELAVFRAVYQMGRGFAR